jgi:hypothetical protein
MEAAVTIRVRKHREQLRAEGLKPVQIWVPDTRSESFRRKCERESLSVASNSSDPLEAETLAWIAEVADTDGWV